MSFLKLSRLKLIGIILLVLVLYNEWILFYVKTFSWSQLTSSDSEKEEESIKILIVADPQILSVQTEPHFPFNHIAVWDANRFISRSFHLGISFTQPDIIIFLGDVINDGSISSEDDFYSLSDTFKNLFPIPKDTKVFYIPGDNDIGGEGNDKVLPKKVQRFKNAFNTSDIMEYKFLKLHHLNIIPGADYSKTVSLNNQIHPSIAPGKNVIFLLSHFPLLTGIEESQLQKIRDLKPSVIFSAHNHDSYKFIGKKSAPKADQFWMLRDDKKVWSVNVFDEDLHEISVPTCSYRMGKQRYGYGFALISRSGVLKYTVLWLPSRFSQLWYYLWGLLLCVALILFPFCVQCHEWFCISPKSARKYHRV